MGFSSTAKFVGLGQRYRIFRKFRGQPPKSFDWIKNHLDLLIRQGRIQVTLPKAKELQQYAEEIIYHAKKDTPESDLIVESMIRTPESRQLLYERYVPLYSDRSFFFTRIINQWRFRFRDGAPMAYLELVDRSGEIRPAKPVGQEKIEYIYGLMNKSRRSFRHYYSFGKKNGLISDGNLVDNIQKIVKNKEKPWHETCETLSTINPEWTENPEMKERLRRIQSIDMDSGVAKETFECTYRDPIETNMPNNNPDITVNVRRPRFNP